MKFNHVLVATDLSDDANSLVSFIGKKILDDAAKVSVISVLEDVFIPLWCSDYVPSPQNLDQFRNDLTKHANSKISKFVADNFNSKNVKAEVLTSVDSSAQTICDYAQKNNCDVIVMGTHGAGALGNLLIGSTVQKVLKLSKVPVLVIPRGAV